MRRLNIGDESTGGNDADPGRSLQQTHFRKLFGSLCHRLFSLSFRLEQLIQDGKSLRKHQFERWFLEIVQQRALTAFGEKPRIEADNAERSKPGLDLGFQTRLLTAQVFVMRDKLFEQTVTIIGLTINRMRPIEPEKFGEFAGINRIVFV